MSIQGDKEEMRDSYVQRMMDIWPSMDSGQGFFISSPGRVNLIGEHTDYNNCPVFPIAVDRRVLGYVVPLQESVIKVADLKVEYGSIEFLFPREPQVGISIPAYETGHWGNYIKAAINQVLQDTVDSQTSVMWPANMVWKRGFAMVMDSTIPQAAGMSSSSALVVLSTIAMLQANGVSFMGEDRRLILSDLCRRAEWYVGTRGGGMDQTAIVMGKKDYATKISFNPIGVEHVPFGEECSIVVAHSTVEAPKTRAMMAAYNRRSIECSFAALFAAKVMQEKYGVEGIVYIGDLTPAKTGLPQERLDGIVSTLFHENPYSLEEISEKLNISIDELSSQYLKMRDGSPFPIPSEGFKLYHRFFHVWTEWQRVEASVLALKNGQLKQLGTLMNESHVSCRDYHEISCPELDKLTEIARANGAWGSRLTGAGFGGCSVSLVAPDSVNSFVKALQAQYYRDYLHLDENGTQGQVFVVRASDGAGLLLT